MMKPMLAFVYNDALQYNIQYYYVCTAALHHTVQRGVSHYFLPHIFFPFNTNFFTED